MYVSALSWLSPAHYILRFDCCRGGYTSAMDVWGLGAIFGELLQRIEYLGQASVPYLKV